MNDNDETPLDPRLTELARAYHEPPAAPREAMWQAIAAARRQGAEAAGNDSRPSPVGSRQRVISPRAVAWISGIAALLALGIGIGRMTAPTGTVAGVATAPVAGRPVIAASATAAPSRALELAAAQHLAQTETYLTLFRASVRNGGGDSLPIATARQLLATNRLLLDSPAADPRLRPLLLDLELVLAEISQLGENDRKADIQLITDGLDHSDVLTRLRVSPDRGSLPIGVL
jgi:hypothetical protein